MGWGLSLPNLDEVKKSITNPGGYIKDQTGVNINLPQLPGFETPQAPPEGYTNGANPDVSLNNPNPQAPAKTPAQLASAAEEARKIRQADIASGVETGQKYLPEGSLGRVNATSTPEMAAAQAAQKSLFTDGFGAQAFQAAREARLRGLNRDTTQQRQQMQQAQARGGIGGALGASQLQNLQRTQGQNRAAAEQDLFLNEVGQKKQALADWNKTASQNEMYNLGQGAKEKIGQIGMGLAEGQMGQAERTGMSQTDIGKAMSAALAAQAGSPAGGKK